MVVLRLHVPPDLLWAIGKNSGQGITSFVCRPDFVVIFRAVLD